METRTIEIKIPSSFTQEQEDFILKSALNQIESEMAKTLAVPKETIDAHKADVNAVLTANHQAEKYAEASEAKP